MRAYLKDKQWSNDSGHYNSWIADAEGAEITGSRTQK